MLNVVRIYLCVSRNTLILPVQNGRRHITSTGMPKAGYLMSIPKIKYGVRIIRCTVYEDQIILRMGIEGLRMKRMLLVRAISANVAQRKVERK
jgi:hypothetical protein